MRLALLYSSNHFLRTKSRWPNVILSSYLRYDCLLFATCGVGVTEKKISKICNSNSITVPTWCTNSFIIYINIYYNPLHVSSNLAHHQEVKLY
jgi:hypothetical protein